MAIELDLTTDAELFDGANKAIAHLLGLIAANQQAWEGEEDSVQEEHADLMALNRRVLDATGSWMRRVADGE